MCRSRRTGNVRGSSALPAARPERSWLSGGWLRSSQGKPCLAARRDRGVERDNPPECGASRGQSPLTFVRLPSLPGGESGPRKSAGATPRLRRPSRAPGGNPQASQTLSGSQNCSWTEGSATPFQTQRLGGVSASAGARVRAPESTRVCVYARGCACVCARV